MGLFNISWYRFCVLAGMGMVWSVHVEMNFLSSLAYVMFVQHLLWYILRPRWQRMSLDDTCWEAICVMAVIRGVWLRCILCPRWHGMFCQHMLRFVLRPRWHGMGLVISCWGEFCVFAGAGWNWSTHADMCFVSSLAWEVFGQNKLRCILCPRWHWMSLVNTRWDAFCVLAFMVNTCWVVSCVLAGLGMLTYFSCSSWHRIITIITCCDAYCVSAIMGWLWTTQV